MERSQTDGNTTPRTKTHRTTTSCGETCGKVCAWHDCNPIYRIRGPQPLARFSASSYPGLVLVARPSSESVLTSYNYILGFSPCIYIAAHGVFATVKG
ncbi:uncharacterized protein BP01DRAFT_35306 [Aspergillus saccharolyticus JOP 1030-1]|uniref:Uncharacterized protein n=1 Tax=Aspergillus saccharolyticus JOP 1030-1 TaxID=1450539 RepID=A0A318ZQ59_9EURO|nr:hypothetical protein BP01DRAFT_35306 [Aspergillus saccharolyticus JOP 1030-1]PYH46080.1 hypothetical protein BP01DRAFT_35306 [Aspergillus saccharolyticus JOP 1030-1]